MNVANTSTEQPLRADPPPNIFRLTLLFEGDLAVLACLVGLFMDVPPWRRLHWQWDSVLSGVAAAVPMMLGLVVIRQMRFGPLARLNQIVDRLLVPLFSGCSIFQLALISAVAGIGEELLFRGVLQPLLIGWIGTMLGIAVASVIFGLLHAVTATYAVLATAVGAYLGWLAVASESLVGPILAHALYDFFALVYLTRQAKNGFDHVA